MIRINKKLALVASLTVVVTGLGTGIAFASGPEPSPSDDSIIPASTMFTSTSTNITFSGHINGLSISVKCTNSSISGNTPPSNGGLGPFTINNPTFSSCGSGLTVTTNSTNGPWQLTFGDLANDEDLVIGGTTDEPAGHGTHSGDTILITIPPGGATFTDAFIFGCTITVAPNGATITGTYDDVNTLTLNTSVPVKASGCTSDSTASVSGTFSSGSTTIQDVS